MRISTALSGIAAAGTLFVLFVPTWNSPPNGTQMGFRAGSMVQWEVQDPAALAKNIPPSTYTYGVEPSKLADTRPVEAVYKSVQVTKGITAGQFMALQVAITNWVAPQEGCAFCHAAPAGASLPQGDAKGDANGINATLAPHVTLGKPKSGAPVPPEGPTPDLDYASDAKPQYAVARTMLQMTRSLNADWSSHVAPSGVTCFTCHRGLNVPAKMFFRTINSPPSAFIGRQEDWHESATTVHDFFPTASNEEYILQDTAPKSQSYQALPAPGSGPSAFPIVIRMYEFMMTMSDDIGVNCGYCHNSRALFDWGQSTPKRWNGLSGIEMTRAINRDVLLPLHQAFPQIRYTMGQGMPPTTPLREANPQSGDGFAVCGTCHYGSPKPLNGASLLQSYPALAGPKP